MAMEKVQILDGGYSVWAKNYGVTKNVWQFRPTAYKAKAQNKKFVTDLEFIKQNLNDPKLKLVDGRPVDQFTGKAPGKVFHTGRAHKKRGHIPGAESVFWKKNFDAEGKFKSKKELEAIYAARRYQWRSVRGHVLQRRTSRGTALVRFKRNLGLQRRAAVRRFDVGVGQFRSSDRKVGAVGGHAVKVRVVE